MRRGSLPLALLIIAVLAIGVVVAVTKEPEGPDLAGPTPAASPTLRHSPATEPPIIFTPEPTESPAESPTAEPTETPIETVEPTETPTETVEPTETPIEAGTPLAKTGGPVLPWFLGGGLLIAVAGALWRLSRVPLE